MEKDEFIDHALKSRLPMEAGKFLVPEIVEFLGFTIEDLKKLKPVFDRIDSKHEYERIIFESYIENGEFRLTSEQLNQAYEKYRQSRQTV